MAALTLPEMSAKARLDAAGLHIPEYAAVLADLQNVFRAIYGPDVYLEPDSQDGALVAALALRIHDCHSLIQSVYNSFAPSTAQGVGLSSVVKVNGLRRKVSSRSQAPLRLGGQAGTTISGGIVGDTQNRNWRLPERVIIPAAGEITVTATAEDEGELRAALGEINRIVTPVRGWQSARNTAAATPGAPVELDSALRRRQSFSTALPSRTVFEGVRAAVAALPGVTRVQAYENDASEPDGNGLPAHSICVVSEGGDAQAIGAAIAVKKTPGCGTYGDIAVPVKDKYGMPTPGGIKFFFAREIALQAKIRLQPLAGYLAATGEAMRANLAAYVNGQEIGEDVLVSKLYTPLNAAEPKDAYGLCPSWPGGSTGAQPPVVKTGLESFDVLELLIGAKGGELARRNLEIPFNGAARLALEDIEVEVDV